MYKAELFTDGEAYERMMGRWSRLAGETFLAWLDLPKGLRWLDVGCGNGAFTEEIIARCAPATVMAIDSSDEQLAFARTRRGAKMAKFEVGDAQKLLFGSVPLQVDISGTSHSATPRGARARMIPENRPRRSVMDRVAPLHLDALRGDLIVADVPQA